MAFNERHAMPCNDPLVLRQLARFAHKQDKGGRERQWATKNTKHMKNQQDED